MATLREFGSIIVPLIRTQRFETGVRGVLYLPWGDSVHTLEDDPIEAGTYFLRPDDTGRFKNWVIETILESRFAGNARWDVEMHAGNTLKDSAACILPGLETSTVGVRHSRLAIDKMRSALERDTPQPKTWVMEISESIMKWTREKEPNR